MNKPLSFMPGAWEDYLYWQATDKKTLKRINHLLKDITRDSFEGIGKPEQLKGDSAGYWSRRINEVDRIVYRVEEYAIIIFSCRSHYDNN